MTNNETTEKPRRKLRISYILIALLLIIIAGSDDGGKEMPVRLSVWLDEDKIYDITFIVER